MTQTLPLSGEWRLSPQNPQAIAQSTRYFSQHQSIPCKLPGDVHSALLEQQLIPDPYYDTCELDIQWVGKSDWVMARSFEVTEQQLLSGGKAILTLTMADTIIDIFINGAEAGRCFNQFRQWTFDVTKLLAVGTNSIELRFTSAEKAALAEASKLPYPIPYSVYPVSSPYRNLIRKTQCHSGWDWGPCLMAMGVYDQIRIDFLDTGRISGVTTDTARRRGGGWHVSATIRYDAWKGGTLPCSIHLKDGCETRNVRIKAGMNEFTLHCVCKEVEDWWPAGQGKQHLYPMLLRIGDQSVEKRIGFRDIEVMTAEDSAGGKSMTFRVNGRDIFAKGANWIPFDAFPSRLTKSRYNQLLQDCVDANMNMLRVWGGGLYEKDWFYELCDEKGLLIWQDCMFSCSMYPATPDFLSNVEEEITYQVSRLHDHASLALWCGNNEDLGAINWYEESKANRDRYLIDYDRLNEGTVGRLVKKLDPNRTWWPSSPSAGPNDFSDNWHNDGRGDMHYWSVWHEGKPFEAYYDIKPRFVSEFGYQSFPSLSTVETYAPDGQLNLTSPVMEHHQKNMRGNSIIIENFSRYFRFPTSFEQMLYLSQAQQALAMRTAIEYWRTLRPYCMGALYWQLDDNWPVASWSSIDYTGKWKLLHYAARRFFDPLTPIAYMKDDKIEVFVVNDTNRRYDDAKLSIKTSRFNGDKLPKQVYHLTVSPQSSTHICTISKREIGAPVNEAFIYLKLRTTDRYVENTLLLDLPKRCGICPPQFDIQVAEAQGGFSVTLGCKAPAFWVSLDAGDIKGRFSDNFFDIRPTAQKQVLFKAKEPCSLDRFKESLKIFDLYTSGHES